MTQNEKDLLLKDLCNRIMYGVKCTVYEDASVHTLSGVLPDNVYNELYFRELDWKECNGFADVQYCKPYLFPLSSMTVEQKNSFPFSYSFLEALIDDGVYFDEDECITLKDMIYVIQWCYKNHFDIYGLIPKGLAIDATGLNIY